MNPNPKTDAPDSTPEASSATETKAPESSSLRDRNGRFLPSNPGPAFKHGLRSELVRSGKLFESESVLVERRDRIRDGDLRDVRTSLANNFVAADVIASGFAAQIALEGPFTKKGHIRATVEAWMKVSSHANRLAQLLGYEPPKSSTAPRSVLDVAHLTDEELETVMRILDNARTRKNAPASEEPDEPEPFVVEVSEESEDANG